MGRRGYPPEFRRKVIDLIDAGRKVADIARDLGISEQTIYTWRRQHRIDQSRASGRAEPSSTAFGNYRCWARSNRHNPSSFVPTATSPGPGARAIRR